MNIRLVTVHGFKSYEDTVVFGPFAPGQNALVGLNGTGKSNFYAAIGFVLLDEFAHIRVSERKGLLHEGQGRNSLTAFVEILFDNASRVMPIDTDEVSVRRSIGLKKDEYFVNRKNSTRQDVHNLLESCGFSPTSGYYIVRQGRVNTLTLMKDTDRLDLLMDIAGTKFYDQQREESLKMIEESRARTDKIIDSLTYIRERLKHLDDEKKELEEFEKLDRERRAVEFLIQNRESSVISEELAMKEEEIGRASCRERVFLSV
jgi:structural maintenance of chromosome 3 (chondroitin sulfate proteoglycan 6)